MINFSYLEIPFLQFDRLSSCNKLVTCFNFLAYYFLEKSNMGARKSKSNESSSNLPFINPYLTSLALAKPYSSFVPFSHVTPLTPFSKLGPLANLSSWSVFKMRLGGPLAKRSLLPLAMPFSNSFNKFYGF
jgi:hypothetical protein